MKIGAKEFRQSFGKYLSLVENGEILSIEKRGKVVCEIFPVGVKKDEVHTSSAHLGVKPSVEAPIEVHTSRKETADVIVRGEEVTLAYPKERPKGIPIEDTIQPKEVIVGNCEACSTPSYELWVLYEDGEKEVCKNCISRTCTPMALPSKLRSMKKAEPRIETISKPSVTLHKTAKCDTFNPILKPVKKKKK